MTSFRRFKHGNWEPEENPGENLRPEGDFETRKFEQWSPAESGR